MAKATPSSTFGMPLARRLGFTIIVLALLSALVFTGLALFAARAIITPRERSRQRLEVERQAAELENRVRGLREDVLALVRGGPLAELVAEARDRGSLTPDLRSQALRLFVALLDAKPGYLQVRLIGLRDGGRELLRVERRPGGPRVVPDDELQPKGDRPYVRVALALPPGEVSVSPVELNRERGRIETPHRPVLRAASPVFDGEGQEPAGTLVINLDMGPALDGLRPSGEEKRRVYLVDGEGGYLVHPSRQREFAAELGGGPRFQDELPELGSFLTARRAEARELELDGSSVLAAAAPATLAGGPRVTLVTVVPSSIASAARSALLPALVASALIVILANLAAYALGRSITRPLSEVTAAAERLSENLDAPLPTGAGGEVGALARAFERMREAVRARDAALRKDEDRLRGIIDAAPNAMIVADRTGALRMVNARAAELFGYRPEELLGAAVETLMPERHRADHVVELRAFMTAPVARAMGQSRDLSGLRKGGGEFPVEIGLTPLEWPGGELVVIASIVDLSARKRIEDELRRSNADLEHFASVASHDLQQPLRSVAGYTGLLSKRYADQLDERARKYIRLADEGARRMQAMIRDLLAYSRVGSRGRALARVETEAVLDRVLRSLKPEIQECEALIERGPLPAVLGDSGQLEQLLQNLIGNAIKFRRPGGPAPKITVSAESAPLGWRFAVADNGIGIGAADLERIFQMFERLHSRVDYEGTGIGLAIARRIVERHGGVLEVSSEPGCGTTFRFTLQAAPDSREA